MSDNVRLTDFQPHATRHYKEFQFKFAVKNLYPTNIIAGKRGGQTYWTSQQGIIIKSKGAEGSGGQLAEPRNVSEGREAANLKISGVTSFTLYIVRFSWLSNNWWWLTVQVAVTLKTPTNVVDVHRPVHTINLFLLSMTTTWLALQWKGKISEALASIEQAALHHIFISTYVTSRVELQLLILR